MPTLPDSGVSFTVQTNGQTLIVAAGTSASSLVQTLYSDAACTSAVTTPHTITSDTTYYLPLDTANVAHYISCKQPDGTELWGKKQHLGGITIAPLPSRAQVGADVRAPLFSYISGQYYFASPPISGSTKSADLGYATASMYYIPETVSIAKIGAEITSTGTAGAVFRIGVWAPSTSVSAPGALIADCGTIDATSATVQDITLGSALVLKPGVYWFGGASQVAACTFRSLGSGTAFVGSPGGATIPSAGTAWGGVAYSGATGAFAATFGTPIAVAMTSSPRIHFKVS